MPVFSFASLAVPIVAAPMAGGPSTPELVVAVGRAGAFGFLAAGYKSAAAVADQIDQVSDAGVPFGVNVFVPDPTVIGVEQEAQLAAYGDAVAPLAARVGAEVPTVAPGRQPDDDWDAKIDLLVDRAVPVVSFTFGLPGREVVERLHGVGTAVVASVASAAEARAAAQLGVDALVVQGPEAGGHRATATTAAEPDETPLPALFTDVAAVVDLPLVASGGLTNALAVRTALHLGAVAVQAGTAFLLADEAGTSATHRAALRDPEFTTTAPTRAFSGRVARGLLNEAMRELSPLAPALYPAVNAMTGPMRRAASAAGDPQLTHLWAGTGWRDAPEGPAADIVRVLATPTVP